jgi:hypothetical protein
MTDMKSRLVRIARWRYAAAWMITCVVAGVAALFLGTLAYSIGWAVIELPSVVRAYPAYRRGELGFLDSAFFGLGLELMIWLPISVYVALYVLPFILTLPASAPIVALWHAPPRALLLRPFNRGPLSRPLKRLVRRDVARYAHVYTLSDADINVPWYVRIPVLIGQLALFSFRMRTIRDARHIARIERATERTWLRNINWCMAFGKIFPIATSDAHWREVVDCLLTRASIVIIDVSDLRDNVTWEIDRARRLGAEGRIFYLVSAELAEQSRHALTQALGPEAAANRLFRYGKDGNVERARFDAALVDSIVAGTAQPNRRFDVIVVAATVAFVVGMLPILALAFPVFGYHLGLPRWTAWEDAAHWPGVAAVANAGALSVVAFGIATWLLLIAAARRAPNLWFLLVIQTLVLLAAPVGMLDW